MSLLSWFLWFCSMNIFTSSTSSSSLGSGSDANDLFFGIPLTTYRDAYTSSSSQQQQEQHFQYQFWIAACSIAFMRWTIPSTKTEPWLLRSFFATALGLLAYCQKPYVLLCAVELFSYVVHPILRMMQEQRPHPPLRTWRHITTPGRTENQFHENDETDNNNNNHENDSKKSVSSKPTREKMSLIGLGFIICMSAIGSFAISYWILGGGITWSSDDNNDSDSNNNTTGHHHHHHRSHWIMATLVLPSWFYYRSIFNYLFPIVEFQRAYDLMQQLSLNPMIVQEQIAHLFFVTFHIQAGMGYLGINFLRHEQERRNQLIRMDVGIPSSSSSSSSSSSDTSSASTTNKAPNHNHNNNDLTSSSDSTIQNGKQKKQLTNGMMLSNSTTSTTTTLPPPPPMDDNDEKNNNNNNHQHQQQQRRLLRLQQRAQQFNRGAGPFILFVALPYMIQIILAGNMNKFAFTCVQHDLHRMIRLYRVFEQDDHLVQLQQHPTATSPDAYANSMNQVLNTNYEIINRKLFSLPKIMLLPAVMAKQPWLVLQVAPFIMLSDWIKGRIMSTLTTKVEDYDKDIKALVSIRSRVESFDLKNAELLQRSGGSATAFTLRQWEALTTKIQHKRVLSDLYARTKVFFNFVQHHFIFSALVDCALAHLIALEKITAADIFVFSRAIEDTIDLILMKSRSEAELARANTEMDRLDVLANMLHKDAANAKNGKNITRRSRNLLPCHLPSTKTSPLVAAGLELTTSIAGRPNITPPQHGKHHPSGSIVLRNLHYSRGTASVRADHVEIPPGVYALTGANGSGKSTLFRILMSCSTNEKSVDLPESILLSTPVEPLVEADDVFRELNCEADEEQASTEGTTNTQQCNTIDRGAQPGECRNNNGGEGKPGVASNGNIRSLSSVSDREADSKHPKPKLSITMPSSRVVEISQTFYWPLYAKPLEWIFQSESHNFIMHNNGDDVNRLKARRVAEKLQELEFVQTSNENNNNNDNAKDNESTLATNEKAILQIIQNLQEEKEDWFSELSGGQKSKVELVRKVFLHDSCPDVLLIDETMAPLDPSSKSLVMSQIKSFCQGSVVIVIYHTDVGQNKEDEHGRGLVECVPSNNFFDSNIHLENQMIHLRPVC